MSAGTKTVVTISRQKGSGASRIGQAIAERRGLRYIDGAMLREASDYLLTNDPHLEQVEERVDAWWSTMAGAIAMGGLSGLGMLPQDTIREADLAQVERRIIEEIAQNHSAVVIGRGAGHVLRGRPGVVSVFLHAPEGWRIEQLAQRTGLAAGDAKDAVRESDKDRAGYNRSLTGADWHDARQYDLSIDTAAVGLDRATTLVLDLLPIT
jgi:cytidylate kinase